MMTTPETWISDRRTLIDAATDDAHTSLPEALDALEAALGLHYRREWEPMRDFMYFASIEMRDQCDHCRRAYPCETITAITAALGIEVQS